MAPWLRVSTALAEDLSLVPRIHFGSAQLPVTSALRDLTPLAFIDTHTPMSIPYTWTDTI